MDFVGMRIPKSLYRSVQKIVEENKGIWLNELEFIREAVREKMATVKTEAPSELKESQPRRRKTK